MSGNENFEGRLLTELRQVAAENPAPRAEASGRRTYGRFAAAGTGAAVVVAAVAIFAGSGGNTTPAYAVEAQPDGLVTVEITSLEDAGGLQKSLREAGVPAVVNYSPAPSKPCVPSGPKGAEAGHIAKDDGGPSLSSAGAPPKGGSESSGPVGGSASGGPEGSMVMTRTDADGTTFSIDPGTIRQGEKVFITTSTSSGEVSAPDGAEIAMSSVAVSVGKQAREPGC